MPSVGGLARGGLTAGFRDWLLGYVGGRWSQALYPLFKGGRALENVEIIRHLAREGKKAIRRAVCHSCRDSSFTQGPETLSGSHLRGWSGDGVEMRVSSEVR